jgi:hypothetical protein
MAAFFDQGIGVQIKNNETLAQILRNIIEKGEEDSKSMFGRDYGQSYKQIRSSLETVILLLEDQQDKNQKR